MECVNQWVEHKRFGRGRILGCDGATVSVRFGETDTRSFLYPDAFDAFLTACDPDFGREVASQLTSKREATCAARLRRQEALALTQAQEKRAAKKASARTPAAPKARKAKK